jgi:GAF domain-containing protein
MPTDGEQTADHTGDGAGRGGREQVVIRTFVELADSLVDDFDVIDLLDRLAAHCVELLTADAAGIMISDDQQRLRVVASTNEQSDWMELLQLEADEGPCMDCFRTGAAVSVDDLQTASTRWPRFVPALAERGIYGSVHALPLRLRGEAIGTLNLFHNEPGPLPAADLALGQAMADVATIGILSEQALSRAEVLNQQLQTALDKRIVIEQAKGVLAERGRLGMDEAFDRLRSYARNNNLRLSDLAAGVVNAGPVTGQVLAAPTNRRRRRP